MKSTADVESTTGSARSWLVIYLKGLAMGCADSVPGVSGGTIALIVGIYERLIGAITALSPSALQYLPELHRNESRKAFVTSLQEMDVPFLVVLASGMLTAIIILARVVQIALTNVPGPTFAFFFGLIGASAIILVERSWLRNPTHLAGAGAGFVIAFLIAGASGQGVVPSSLPVVFIAGALAISGMLLPGISGAFILLLFGQYDYMTATLNRFVDELLNLASDGITMQLLGEATVVVTFLAGAAVGVLTVAYAVRWALARHRGATLAFLVSLMIGSLRLPVIEMRAATEPSAPGIGTLIVAIVVGAGLVFVLDSYTDDLSY